MIIPLTNVAVLNTGFTRFELYLVLKASYTKYTLFNNFNCMEDTTIALQCCNELGISITVCLSPHF